MTGLGKIFVFVQFALAMGLLALGVSLYANHIDWEAAIKADAKRITELGAERDRAEARWAIATTRLLEGEKLRPIHQKRYDEKLLLARTGQAPGGAAVPAAVTEVEYDKNAAYLNLGFLNVLGTKPVKYRGEDVQFYTKIEEDLARYNKPRVGADGRESQGGLIPEKQQEIKESLAAYVKLSQEINGDGMAQRGLRKERELQDDAKAKALAEGEYLKPFLANRYAETVLLLKRQNALLARKAELEKNGVAANVP